MFFNMDIVAMLICLFAICYIYCKKKNVSKVIEKKFQGMGIELTINSRMIVVFAIFLMPILWLSIRFYASWLILLIVLAFYLSSLIKLSSLE